MKNILRLLALLFTLALFFTSLVGCAGQGSGDGHGSGGDSGNSGDSGNTSESGDNPDTDGAPDPRINLADYAFVRSDRASEYVTSLFGLARREILDRFGVGLKIGDDWFREGDYDSERVAALREILVGTVRRPECDSVSAGLGKNDWRIEARGNKIVIVGGNDFAVGAAVDAFLAAVTGAEKTDDGRLLLDAEALTMTGISETKYLVGLTDQKNSTVRVCDLTGGSVSVADSIWSRTYEYYNIADTRLREYGGREVVLAAYGGSSASMVSFDDKKEELWRTDMTAQNPHACELIPCGVIAVAASSGGEIRFFDAAGDGKSYVSASLADSHGLLWDAAAGVLWAVGRNVLTAYEVTLEGGKITVTERTDLRATIPSDWAHDLQPCYGDTDRMWVTTSSAVYVYSKSQGAFLTDFSGSRELQRKNVKGIGNFSDGSVVLITPDGAFKSWTGRDLDFYLLIDGKYAHMDVKSTDGGFYKVRVWNKNYQ